jgi:hypothetical protein
MDIQGFFVKHNCFLANILIDGVSPANIIRKYCFESNVNPRWVLARMQTERCMITGIRKGDYFIIPGHRKRIKIVLREACGFGLSWNYNGHKLNGYKYIGFVSQVKNCADFMGRNLRSMGMVKTLRLYDPTVKKYDGVGLFLDVWRGFWPTDFK